MALGLHHIISTYGLVIGTQVEYLLNTGNLGTGSRSNIDLSQASGFTIVAEKLNFFRCASPWACMTLKQHAPDMQARACDLPCALVHELDGLFS